MHLAGLPQGKPLHFIDETDLDEMIFHQLPIDLIILLSDVFMTNEPTLSTLL